MTQHQRAQGAEPEKTQKVAVYCAPLLCFSKVVGRDCLKYTGETIMFRMGSPTIYKEEQ